MDIEAGAGAHIRDCIRDCLGADEVVHRGQLEIAGLARKRRNRDAGPFGERRVIGKIVEPRLARAAMSFDERSEEKSLRGLHRAQFVPIERGDDGSGLIDAFDGIAQRNDRDRGACGFDRGERAVDEGGRGEGTGRIMDEDDRRFQFRQRLEPGADGALARGSTRGRRQAFWQFADRASKGRALGRIDHRLHRIDRGMQGERAECTPQNRLAEESAILLGLHSARPLATAGGDDNRCRAHHHLPSECRA